METRKKIRLENFDYSTEGYYFITICTANKKKILGTVVGEGLCALPKIVFTDIGINVEKALLFINNKYNAKIDKYVIMPNHIHFIIKMAGGHGDPPLQSIIGYFKSYTTKLYKGILWQRSFYDHIIRDENDYLKIWNYIDTNPAKWAEDKYYVE